MPKLTRYIMRQMAIALLFVSVGLAALIWLTQSLRFVEVILNRGLSIGTFFHLTALMLPNFLVVILPVALFAVTLFTYSRMNNDRELMVMRAAGMSQLGLAAPALGLAAIVTAISSVLSLYVVPEARQAFHELQFNIRHKFSAILLQEGVFNQVTEGLTVYVRERSRSGEMLGVIVHDTRTADQPITMMAERGILLADDDTPRVLLVNGNRQEVDRKTGQLSMLYFDQNVIDIGRGQTSAEPRYREATERSLSELLAATPDSAGPRDYGRFIVEAHQRIISPLLNISYVLVALAALLRGEFSRHGQLGRVLAAVAIVVLLQAGALGIGNLASRNVDLVPLIYLHALLPSAAGYWYLVHLPRRRARVQAAA